MLFSNLYIRLSMAFQVGQQIMLGLSTLFIAKAGVSVAENQMGIALSHISYFFLLALGGFILNIFATLLSEKGRNSSIRLYYDQFSNLAYETKMINTTDNRTNSVNWVIGEAAVTIDEIVSFIADSVGTILNLLITLVVFIIVLGWQISFVIAASIGAAIVVTIIIRDKITKLGRDMQQSRLASNKHVARFWDGIILSSGSLQTEIITEQYVRLDRFFGIRLQYRLWEQLGAALPVALSVIAIVCYINLNSLWTLPAIGAAVAVLPRSLQLLGSAHAISIFTAQYFLYSEKYRKLLEFWDMLKKFDPTSSINWSTISITDVSNDKKIVPTDILIWKDRGFPNCGRFRITGPNGSGKSSIARLLHQEDIDDVYYGPDANFILPEGCQMSTGQRQKANLDFLLCRDLSVFILDEWDANLDASAKSEYDAKIDQVSKNHLVIEIRHEPT